jgi:hypothetical protein
MADAPASATEPSVPDEMTSALDAMALVPGETPPVPEPCRGDHCTRMTTDAVVVAWPPRATTRLPVCSVACVRTAVLRLHSSRMADLTIATEWMARLAGLHATMSIGDDGTVAALLAAVHELMGLVLRDEPYDFHAVRLRLLNSHLIGV